MAALLSDIDQLSQLSDCHSLSPLSYKLMPLNVSNVLNHTVRTVISFDQTHDLSPEKGCPNYFYKEDHILFRENNRGPVALTDVDHTSVLSLLLFVQVKHLFNTVHSV